MYITLLLKIFTENCSKIRSDLGGSKRCLYLHPWGETKTKNQLSDIYIEYIKLSGTFALTPTYLSSSVYLMFII